MFVYFNDLKKNIFYKQRERGSAINIIIKIMINTYSLFFRNAALSKLYSMKSYTYLNFFCIFPVSTFKENLD